MELSILDQVPVFTNQTPKQALEAAVDLAQHAEKWEYKRIWYSEHHGGDSLASSAPEIIASQVAAKTERIRVGTGGVMMMHYSPLKIAEVFRTMENFAPGRIDLGIGRAPGGNRNAILALSEGRAPLLDNLYGKLKTIKDMMEGKVPEDDLYWYTKPVPDIDTLPQMWLLGSSGDSALHAGRMGLGYSFAQFFSGKMDKEVFEVYKSSFNPSSFMPKPQISVAFFVLACETEEEARYYELPYAVNKMRLMRGQPLTPYPTPEEAAAMTFTETEKMTLAKLSESHLIGTPAQVMDQLESLQEGYGFHEAMLVTIASPHEKRLESYRLLAQENKKRNER